MSDFLAQMAQSSAARAQRAKAQKPLEQLSELAQQLERVSPPTPLKVEPSSFGVIAEIKVRSPAEGALADGMSLEGLKDRAREYIAGGACALSVLTEPDRFEGKLSYLSEVSDIARDEDVAVMRKDFLVDPYQIFEARVAGADGVLLIARMLNDDVLTQMLETAAALNMFVLLEAFDEADLLRCAPHANDQVILGLNCRDLSTLKIDPKRFEEIAPAFPPHGHRVAESGVYTAEHAAGLAKVGYDMALIGTALMKSSNPARLIGEIVDAGSDALVQR